MSFEVRLKILKSSSPSGVSKTVGLGRSIPVGILSSSGWSNWICGGDLAARRWRSLQGVVARGLSAAKEAKFCRKVLKLMPSKVAWFVATPIAKPPHLKDVNCSKHRKFYHIHYSHEFFY